MLDTMAYTCYDSVGNPHRWLLRGRVQIPTGGIVREGMMAFIIPRSGEIPEPTVIGLFQAKAKVRM